MLFHTRQLTEKNSVYSCIACTSFIHSSGFMNVSNCEKNILFSDSGTAAKMLCFTLMLFFVNFYFTLKLLGVTKKDKLSLTVEGPTGVHRKYHNGNSTSFFYNDITLY